MAIAFILINAETGKENDVTMSLKKIPEVKDVYMVYGVYDIIARVETENMEKLKDVINLKIRRVDMVNSTLTMIVI